MDCSKINVDSPENERLVLSPETQSQAFFWEAWRRIFFLNDGRVIKSHKEHNNKFPDMENCCEKYSLLQLLCNHSLTVLIDVCNKLKEKTQNNGVIAHFRHTPGIHSVFI